MLTGTTDAKSVRVGAIEIANSRPFVLIAGPCQIESEAHALEVAAALVEITRAAGISLIYKSSFDKANRTSASAARGIGIDAGLQILARVRETYGVPVLTDVHLPEQCAPTAEAVMPRAEVAVARSAAASDPPSRGWVSCW